MHYGAYAFSRNRQPTIVPKVSGVGLNNLGQRNGLSNSDFQHVEQLYCRCMCMFNSQECVLLALNNHLMDMKLIISLPVCLYINFACLFVFQREANGLHGLPGASAQRPVEVADRREPDLVWDQVAQGATQTQGFAMHLNALGSGVGGAPGVPVPHHVAIAGAGRGEGHAKGVGGAVEAPPRQQCVPISRAAPDRVSGGRGLHARGFVVVIS